MQNKRAVKKSQENPGGLVNVESPVSYSNVSLIDPVTKAPVKVSWRYLEDGSKVRVTRGNLASGSIIPRPEILKQRKKPRPASVGNSDTTIEQAVAETYSDELPTALKVFMDEYGLSVSDSRIRYSKRSTMVSPPLAQDSSRGSEDI
jgi:ribosomal protein L24